MKHNSLQRLNSSTLKQLPDSVAVPQYDRDNTGVGIVHLGVGAFHRAHQAWYTEQVLNDSGGDWAIIGASLRSAAVSEQMRPQDCLYTVVAKTDSQKSCQVIGAIRDVLAAPQEAKRLLELLAALSTRVVTLTITEKGYHYNTGAACLTLTDADIVHDLQTFGEDIPITAIGFIVTALAERMRAGRPGLALLSCDNLERNGEVLRQVVQDFAAQVDPSLANWISTNTSFPSSMVDRIVPATTAESVQELAGTLGVEDRAAVFTEPFSQWVIEDNFICGRPDWERAGALLVTDVTPFEDAKLRLLNGSHSLIAYLGFLAGYDYVHQVVNDADFASLVERYMDEVVPGLQLPDSFDLGGYRQQLLERFGNAALNHRTAQIAEDGSQKIVQRWLNSVAHADCANLNAHALALAGWVAFQNSIRANGEAYQVIDPMAQVLKKIVEQSEEGVIERVLQQLGLASMIDQQPQFIRQTSDYLRDIKLQGVQNTVNQFISTDLG